MASRSSPSGAFVQEPERAFTRRQPGVNPIALELDRLAEQRALQTLGSRRAPGMLPRSEDRTATDAPIPTAKELAADDRNAAFRAQLQQAWDLRPDELDAAMQRALQPFDYEPGDPHWGGLEEDEAYGLWADRLADVAKGYPDMTDMEREAFRRAFAPKQRGR